MADMYEKRYDMQLDRRALRTFADLRNALVHHDYYGGNLSPYPVPKIVARIEALRRQRPRRD